MLRNEVTALKEFNNNSALNLCRGTTTVIVNETEKIAEAKVQLDNRVHHKPLRAPIVNNTQARVNRIIDQMYRVKHIDDITKKWLSQTPNPPRILILYTLTKIHKPLPIGKLT